MKTKINKLIKKSKKIFKKKVRWIIFVYDNNSHLKKQIIYKTKEHNQKRIIETLIKEGKLNKDDKIFITKDKIK